MSVKNPISPRGAASKIAAIRTPYALGNTFVH